MKKIKILRIIARLNVGGPAIHTVLLTVGLDKTKFDSLLVCGAVSSGEGDMEYYAAERQVKPVYIPQLRRELNVFNDLIAFIKIFRLVKAEKPDIIHTHTAKAGTLGRLAGIVYNCQMRLLRFARNDGRSEGRLPRRRRSYDAVKLIHTFHGHIFDGYFNKFLASVFIIIEKFLAYFSSRIITVSESVKKELIDLGVCKSDKIEVIPLGFELDKFLDINADSRGCLPSRQAGNADIRRLNVGIVGRLVPIKNHYLFLDAVSKIVKENPELKAKFKIIGDGELRQGLEEYSCKLNIANCVEFLGWQKDLVKVYSGLDIVCLTSLNEGTPVSLIEAMASGKAIVATDAGGVRDLLGDEKEIKDNFVVRERGVTAKSKDADGFAKALMFILQNEEVKRNLSKDARDYVKDRFCKERLISDMEELYLKVLKIE